MLCMIVRVLVYRSLRNENSWEVNRKRKKEYEIEGGSQSDLHESDRHTRRNDKNERQKKIKLVNELSE